MGVKRRLAVVVRPMDSFTGGIVDPGEVRVFLEDGAAVIRKPGGYTAFWDNGSPVRKLILESPIYEREERMIVMEEMWKRESLLLPVWLKPGKDYPYPSGIYMREERGRPGEVVPVTLEGSGGFVRLLASSDSDPRIIRLEVPEGIEVEGRMFFIHCPGGQSGEFFTVEAASSSAVGDYWLREPLIKSYTEYDAEILFVLQVTADSDGVYRVPAWDRNP